MHSTRSSNQVHTPVDFYTFICIGSLDEMFTFVQLPWTGQGGDVDKQWQHNSARCAGPSPDVTSREGEGSLVVVTKTDTDERKLELDKT